MPQLVEKIEKGKFKIEWESVPDSTILLDFNPLMNVFNLHNRPLVLEHWQAKPEELRRWGLYCVLSDNYFPADFDKIYFGNNLKIGNLQISDRGYPGVRPTAVKVYEKAVVSILGNEQYYIGEMLGRRS